MEKRISLVMSQEDYNIILKKAKDLGLTFSAYIRLASLKYSLL